MDKYKAEALVWAVVAVVTFFGMAEANRRHNTLWTAICAGLLLISVQCVLSYLDKKKLDK